MNSNPRFLLPRKATRISKKEGTETRPLSEWRSLDAFVLLGEPGIGKSVALQQEHESDPANTIWITARNLVTIGPPPGSEGKTLLIDALDEQRASSSDHTGPLDKIRIRLNELGKPRFRLSCREADWIQSDTADLAEVSPSRVVEELRLEPLDKSEVLTLLKNGDHTKVDDPLEFLNKANQRRLHSLLGNPLLLELLVEAVKGHSWPTNRHETYILACRRLAAEQNKAHQIAHRHSRINIDTVLHDAGLLCAILLLSDNGSFITDGSHAKASEISLDLIPNVLGIQHEQVFRMLSTKLFTHEGGRCVYRHRTIAEFLAAKAISELIKKGLPINRPLALMSGFDGKIVEPLRGLYAWLATCCATEREILIDRDPLGLVLYGDVQPFSALEKRRLIDALYKVAEGFRWFRNENWESPPFGALGTADMAPTFKELLIKKSRDAAHEATLDCVMDAIRHGEDIPELVPSLEHVIRDASHWGLVRKSALEALLKLQATNLHATQKLLDDIASDIVEDEDDELLGLLLNVLYPQYIRTHQVFEYLHSRKQDNLIGYYHMFWASALMTRTPIEQLPILMDELALVLKRNHDDLHKYTIDTIADRLIPQALNRLGATESVERIFHWITAATGRYGSPELSGNEAEAMRVWFESNPQRQKELFAYALRQAAQSPSANHRSFWTCEQLLYRAAYPIDWYSWLLKLADTSVPESVARYCLENAAYAVVHLSDRYSITVDQVTEWVAKHASIWPDAHLWLQEVWSSELDGWQHREYLRNRKAAMLRETERRKRKENMAKFLPSLQDGTAPPALLENIAFAYDNRLSEINGGTPMERIKNLLVTDEYHVEQAISAIKGCLQRNDLPTWKQIFDLSRLEGKRYYLQAACLLATQILEEEAPNSCVDWNDELVLTMAAFCLVANDTMPKWFGKLAHVKPKQLAIPFLSFIEGQIQREQSRLPGLHFLQSDERAAELARHVLPDLLKCFPEQASDNQLRALQNSILPAALVHLDSVQLADALNERLAIDNVDIDQKITLLVTNLRFDFENSTLQLIDYIGTNTKRTITLGDALQSMLQRGLEFTKWGPDAIGQMVKLLAVHVGEERQLDVPDYTNLDRLRDVVGMLLRQLGSSPNPAAGIELLQLRRSPAMASWWVTLEAHYFEHIKIARAHAFRFANIHAVAGCIANRTPANASDLAALLIDQIKVLADHIRNDNTNKIRLFWENDSKQILKPKAENDCRDTLMAFIRERMLHFGVQVEKEVHAAGEKRSDTHASAIVDGKRISIPMEIKKDDHSKVWSAWHAQLLDLYSTDPAASGLGVYLVLWFGVAPKRSPDGKKPKSAQEMAAMFSTMIPAEYHSRLSGMVMDLSQLNSQPRKRG